MRRKSYKGLYQPIHREKYKGTYPIIWRSKMELKMFRWFDVNSRVQTWTSETVVVPYIHPKDGKFHRYFVDCSCTIKNRQGKIERLLIEVKPKSQTRPPSKRLKPKNYLYESAMFQININKWTYAKEWADKRGYKFVVISEDFLNKNHK